MISQNFKPHPRHEHITGQDHKNHQSSINYYPYPYQYHSSPPPQYNDQSNRMYLPILSQQASTQIVTSYFPPHQYSYPFHGLGPSMTFSSQHDLSQPFSSYYDHHVFPDSKITIENESTPLKKPVGYMFSYELLQVSDLLPSNRHRVDINKFYLLNVFIGFLCSSIGSCIWFIKSHDVGNIF